MGGTLYQDIATQVPGALNHRDWTIYEQNCHATSFVPGSGLAQLYPGATLVKTNSIHHQAVKDSGRDLVVEARSEPDRVVEAIRWTRARLRVRRAMAPGVPRAGRSFVHRRHADPRRFLAAAARAQGRGLRALTRQGRPMKIINPATGAVIAEVAADSAAAVRRKYAARARRPAALGGVPIRKRLDAIAAFRERIVAMHETLARTLTQEVGKPIRQSRNELNGLLGRHRLLPRRVGARAARREGLRRSPGRSSRSASRTSRSA